MSTFPGSTPGGLHEQNPSRPGFGSRGARMPLSPIDKRDADRRRLTAAMTRRPAMKRALDAVISAFGLIVLMPPMLIIAYLVRRSSPGDALFVQTRVDRAEKPFPVQVQGYGLRRVARRIAPQLFNVVSGDMSLSGCAPAF